MDQVEVAVIGAGVVGLAVARELALRGREVVVIEAAAAIGTGISSRNSEVIHAGIYCPAGLFKARLCVQGAACPTTMWLSHAEGRAGGHRPRRGSAEPRLCAVCAALVCVFAGAGSPRA